MRIRVSCLTDTPNQSSVAFGDLSISAGCVMKDCILALSLLFLASQGSWCAADETTADHHLQVQEFHGTEEGKKSLEIQSTRKLGHGQSFTKHDVTTVEIKHVRRIAIGHKGGSTGGGSAGGGGGGATMRPHNKKNGAAAALPVPPVASVLALCLACGLALSVSSF